MPVDKQPGAAQSQAVSYGDAIKGRLFYPIVPYQQDCRILIRTLVLGLKNIVWGIFSCSPNPAFTAPPPSSGNNQTPPPKIQIEESHIFVDLLKCGLKCFPLFSKGPAASVQDEKDVLSLWYLS